MSTAIDTIEQFVNTEYKYGFVSDIETDSLPPGLTEDTVRAISARRDATAEALRRRGAMDLASDMHECEAGPARRQGRVG